MFGFLSKNIGIDLGTANILVHVAGQGIVVDIPSIIAIDSKTQKVIAIGQEAKAMLGKTPKGIDVIRPMKDGVIADFRSIEILLYQILRSLKRSLFSSAPNISVGVPSGITPVEKKAVVDALQKAGAKDVHLIAEPMAAAIGMGLDVEEASGNMIIDIGGGTSEIAVISLCGIVSDASIRVGGDNLDTAIVNFLKKNKNLSIGHITAEKIKFAIGSAYTMTKELSMTVGGLDIVRGIPRQVQVRSEEIREALSEPINQIVEAFKFALENTPPELSPDIIEKGVILTGGGSCLRGLNKRLKEETGLMVTVIDNGLVNVCDGTAKVINDLEKYKNVIMRIND